MSLYNLLEDLRDIEKNNISIEYEHNPGNFSGQKSFRLKFIPYENGNIVKYEKIQEIIDKYNTRSNAFHRYYFYGVNWLSNETGIDKKLLHKIIKINACEIEPPSGGEKWPFDIINGVAIPDSESGANNKQMMTLCFALESYAVDNGLIIPYDRPEKSNEVLKRRN